MKKSQGSGNTPARVALNRNRHQRICEINAHEKQDGGMAQHSIESAYLIGEEAIFKGKLNISVSPGCVSTLYMVWGSGSACVRTLPLLASCSAAVSTCPA